MVISSRFSGAGAVARAVREVASPETRLGARKRVARDDRGDHRVTLLLRRHHALVRELEEPALQLVRHLPVGVAVRPSRANEAAHLRLADEPRFASLASGPVQRHLHLAAGVAAEHGTVVDERDAQAVPRRRKRRAEPARTRPHHDEVKRPAVRDLVAVAREALTLRRKRLGFLRRHVRKVGREEERVAARQRAGEIEELDFTRTCVERKIARLLPHPALATRRAKRAAALPRDLDRELAGRELGQPVLRAYPHAPRSCARDRDLRGRRGNGLQNARREQVRAPHLMRELRIDHPSAVVREVLRLQPHESRHLLLRLLRWRAEFVVHVLAARRNALGRVFARNDVRLLAGILQ